MHKILKTLTFAGLTLLFSAFINQKCSAQTLQDLKIIPSALVIGKGEPKSFVVRVSTNPEFNANSISFCVEIDDQCLELKTSTSRFTGKRRGKLEEQEISDLEYENVLISPALINILGERLAKLKQGESLQSILNAKNTSGEVLLSTPIYFYPELRNSLSKNYKEVRVNKNDKKQNKREKQKNVKKDNAIGINATPSTNYRSPGGIDADTCSGTNLLFRSSYDYYKCADQAIIECTQTDEYEEALCIRDRCGNTPDNFAGLWRDIDGGNNDGGGQSYTKDGFGSESFAGNTFQIMLHPCLLDGAAKVSSTFNAASIVMGDATSLVASYFEVFHPARPENLNLSNGRIRMSFNNKVLFNITTDNFGETTVPYSYYQEYFQSLERSRESQAKVHFINGVVPVMMYYRPQGILGLEVQARVSPASRVLELNFASYGDFGTASGAGPARDGVQKVSTSGLLSLFQAEHRSTKYISFSADDLGIRPALSEFVQLEYWPPKGSFKPCAQWFADNSTNPGKKAYQCGTLIDFGPLSERVGAVRTFRDGTERIIEYRDPSDEQEPEDTYFPYRSPILDDF